MNELLVISLMRTLFKLLRIRLIHFGQSPKSCCEVYKNVLLPTVFHGGKNQ